MKYTKKRHISDIKRVIGEIIETEVRDETIKNVSITDITIDDDFTFATVYFMTRLTDYKKLEANLNKASSFIRKELAKRLDLRSTPTLKFVYDDTIDYAKKIDDLIESENNE